MREIEWEHVQQIDYGHDGESGIEDLDRADDIPLSQNQAQGRVEEPHDCHGIEEESLQASELCGEEPAVGHLAIDEISDQDNNGRDCDHAPYQSTVLRLSFAASFFAALCNHGTVVTSTIDSYFILDIIFVRLAEDVHYGFAWIERLGSFGRRPEPGQMEGITGGIP